MTENTVAAAPSVLTPQDPTLDALHTVAVQAVADLDRAKATGSESVEDHAARIFRNTNEDEVPGIDAVRDAIMAIVNDERAKTGDLSDDQRADLRKTARERYNKAKTTFDTLVSLGAATPAEGYTFPVAPGGGRVGGPLGERGFDSPKGLKHVAKIGDKTVEGTFATLAQAAKVETKVVVNTLKDVVEDWDSITADESVTWAFADKDGNAVNVETRRVK